MYGEKEKKNHPLRTMEEVFTKTKKPSHVSQLYAILYINDIKYLFLRGILFFYRAYNIRVKKYFLKNIEIIIIFLDKKYRFWYNIKAMCKNAH
jgi:hypothetical protein